MLSGNGRAQDQIDPMAPTILPNFTMIEQPFISLADAMPSEKFGFKPTEGEFGNVRTFAGQVKHVACANFAFFNKIEKKGTSCGMPERRTGFNRNQG